MKHLFTLIITFSTILATFGQSENLTAKEQTNATVKDIVITEKTYNDITNQQLNRRKLMKLADKSSKSPRVADDPYGRINFEIDKLKDPKTGKIPANIRELELKYIFSSNSGLQSKLKAGGLTFTNSGPINVGGRTRALAIDIKNSNTILAGGVSGGLWKSTDNGASWKRVTDLDKHPSITSIAQDPREGHTDTWYYTTGEGTGNSANGRGAFYYGNGLFKSTDNGETWAPIASTASNTLSDFNASELFDICWNICVDPNNGDVYVATYGAIYVSKDGGDSWQKEITANGTLPQYTDVICTPAGVKYATLSSDAATNEGIWRKGSENDATWVNITPNTFPEGYNRLVIGHAPSNTSKDIVYLLGNTPGAGSDGHSFWKLTYDTGATWEDRSQNLPTNGGGDRDVDGYNSQGSYNMVVKVAPDNEDMVFIGGTNLHRSTDGFASKNNTKWIGGYATANNVSSYQNHHPDVHSLVFKPDNATLVCGHDGGLSITTDYKANVSESTPVVWSFLNNGYLTTQSYTVAIDENTRGSKILVSGFQDNGTWLASNTTSSTIWDYIGSGDGSHCQVINDGNSVLYSSQNGTTILEHNRGGDDQYWTRVDPEGASGQLFINPYIVDAVNSKIMYYAAGQYVWRNSNIFDIPKYQNGSATLNWEQLEVSKVTGTVSYLASSTTPSHILYYGTSLGKLYKLENSHKVNAKQTDITGDAFPQGYISSISINPQDANEVIVSFSNYGIESVFYTKDGGTNWTAVSGNLEDGTDSGNGPSVRSVAIMVSPTDTTFYAGTSTGLYSTSDLNGASTSWTQEAVDKIGTTVVDMIKVRHDGLIAVGTHGNGVFTSDADYSASAPIAAFGISQDTIKIGQTVDFINKTIGDGSLTWEWTFDGAETTSSTTENPSEIVYNTPGFHNVTLKATNSSGSNTLTIEKAVVVKSVHAKFSASKTAVSVGDVVTFKSLSGSAPTTYSWSFPGGSPTSSTDKDVDVTYNTVGTYDVSFTVSDDQFSDTYIRKNYITVLDPDDFDDRLLYNVEEEFEDQLTQFIFTGTNDGYVTGHTSLAIDAYAEKFSFENPNLNAVKAVHIFPTKLIKQSSDPHIYLKVWSGSTEPEEVLYSEKVDFDDLETGKFNTLDLNIPVKVDQEFFVGYELSYETPIDTFAVAHLPLDAAGGWDNTAYMHLDGDWREYNSVFNGNPNTSLAIKALVGFDAGATGIDDKLTDKKVGKLKIYPNPMVDKSKVEFPNEKNQKFRLVVVDASGRVVRIIENVTGNNVIINREQLKPGIHIINLSGEKLYKGKLLVK